MLLSKYKTRDGKINLSIVFNESELKRCKNSPYHFRVTYTVDYEVHLDKKTKIKLSDIIDLDKLPNQWKD